MSPAPPFAVGDPLALVQPGKPAPFYVLLREAGTVNVRGHRFPHAALVGLTPGAAIRSPQGEVFYAVRPTLADWVESMPRFAKTIYPKDAGPILLLADLYPGARILEAGLGSGGLSLSLLRAIGPTGQLVSYDTREASLKRGQANIAAWHGAAPATHTVREVDIYAGLHPDDADFDRIVLDLPEPWQVIPHLPTALRPGGLIATFLPTILQVHQHVDALKDTGRFPEIHTIEVLQRRWQIGRRAVRPDNHMVGHTGFLTVGRYVSDAEPIDVA